MLQIPKQTEGNFHNVIIVSMPPKPKECCFIIDEFRIIHIHENDKSSMSWFTVSKRQVRVVPTEGT